MSQNTFATPNTAEKPDNIAHDQKGGGTKAGQPGAPEQAPDMALKTAHSNESERLVIGAILGSSASSASPEHIELQNKLLSTLAAADFYLPTHEAIWQAAIDLRESNIRPDAVAVVDFASRRNIFIGGTNYLVEMLSDPLVRSAKADSIEAASKRIKEYSVNRKLQEVLTQTAKLANGERPATDIMTLVEDEMQVIRRSLNSSKSGPRHIEVFTGAYVEKLINAQDNPESVVTDSVSTGFPALDEVLGGGLPVGMIILAGRPAMGKSAFSTAIENNISTRGIPTLTFSGEMSGQQIAQRKISRNSRVPFQDVRMYRIESDEDTSRIVDSISLLNATESYIDDTVGLTISEICARTRQFAATVANGKFVTIIDYLQIIEGNPDMKNRDPMRMISEFSRRITALSKELRIPILTLSQLNRALEARANKRPMMSDIRESGQVEQDAEAIMFLYRDEVYNPDSPDRNVTEVIVAKSRDSQPGVVKFHSDLSRMAYTELGAHSMD